MKEIVINNKTIRHYSDTDYYRLSDLHRASGLGVNKAPCKWLRSKSVQATFANEIESVTGGVNGGYTDGTLNALIAYARWLHADLYAAVLEALDTDVDVVIVRDRNEIKFGSSIIANMFSAYTIIPQYPVLGYRIDWYIPELKLAIEYDELHHSKPANTAADAERQAAIEKELGCKFIRYKEEA